MAAICAREWWQIKCSISALPAREAYFPLRLRGKRRGRGTTFSLDLDVKAHFQHPLMGDFEEVGSPARDPGEERVDREGHCRHRRALCAADHDFMGDVIVHLMQIDLEAPHLATLERHGNVRRLHEAEPDLDVMDAV